MAVRTAWSAGARRELVPCCPACLLPALARAVAAGLDRPAAPVPPAPAVAGGPASTACQPIRPVNPATEPATNSGVRRLVLPAVMVSSSYGERLMMDGFFRDAKVPEQLDGAGHEALGPADVDVAPVQVADEPTQRLTGYGRLLAWPDELMELAVLVPDQVADLAAERQIVRPVGPQHDDRPGAGRQALQQRPQRGHPDACGDQQHQLPQLSIPGERPVGSFHHDLGARA